jgi:hypothetical protein
MTITNNYHNHHNYQEEQTMKRSEAFRQAQIAVLGANMPISVRAEVLEVLMWEEHWSKQVEEMQAAKEKENATL